MKQYKVIRTNYGYKGRYWTEGEIVDFEDNDNPPHHFELVGSKEEQPKKNDGRPDPMKPLSVDLGKPIKPNGGFAAEHKIDLPKETVTAGKALKNKK